MVGFNATWRQNIVQTAKGNEQKGGDSCCLIVEQPIDFLYGQIEKYDGKKVGEPASTAYLCNVLPNKKESLKKKPIFIN